MGWDFINSHKDRQTELTTICMTLVNYTHISLKLFHSALEVFKII